MSHQATAPAPEFSRVVIADRVQQRELVEEIEATPAERKALAERFELEEIGRLTAVVRLRRMHGGAMIRVEGTLEAEVVQTCVVTLDPVPARVSERFGAVFAPPSMIPDDEVEIDLDALSLDEDLPEPMENGRIDIGELAAQHLSLALDPYPRAPGVDFAGFDEHGGEHAAEDAEPAEEPARPNPFAELAKLKRPL